DRRPAADNRPYRGGGRGDNRGGGRGSGGFGGGRGDAQGNEQTMVDQLMAPDMFEKTDSINLNPVDNTIIPDCGKQFGSFGDVVPISSNYFRITALPNCMIHQYLVEFSPNIESFRLRQGILCGQKQIVKSVLAFDGSTLYLPYKVDDTSVVTKTAQGTDITMTVKYTASVAPGSPTAMVVLNIVFRKVMKLLDMKQIKRHHFLPKEAKTIANLGLEVWPGIAGSLNFFSNFPLYCVDVAHHVMRCENVYELIKKNLDNSNNPNRECIERAVNGNIVLTRYNNRTYRIDQLDWSKTPKTTFDLKDGKKISYIEYYKQHYNIIIEDEDQPLLVSIMKERRVKHEAKQAGQKGELRAPSENIVHLIPELSFLTGITDDMRSNFHAMKEISKFTRLGPTARCNGIFGFLKTVQKSEPTSELLNSWGVEFKKQLITVPARHYPPEQIFLEDMTSPFTPDQKDVDWTPAFKNFPLRNPSSLNRWICFRTQRDRESSNSFISLLMQSCESLNFRVAEPEIRELYNANTSEFVKEIRSLNSSYDMAMFIIPPNRKEIYDAIKTACCVDNPLPTQVILSKTLQRQNALRSVATKVAIQMSVKRGGEPWVLTIPSKKKMIVGIDVCHDTGSNRNSWLGFVASLNSTFTRYYSKAIRQPPRTEIADSLHALMKTALEQYHKFNECFPDAIIIYRDGVGDGQIEVVKLHELLSIKNCLKEVCGSTGFVPAIVFIIVRKRISTRLFSVGNTTANNPLPGTIVDRIITKDEYPNFYLVSQSVREGTVNPTHYIIIYNTSKVSTDHIQRLSYKACHLYFNWMGTVRVPAPCQYAHKLCFLVSQSIKKEPSSSLSNILYYL
ncbi:hypothetical protein MXB_3807, partial [Myxobolus squamalis]